jgi:hypothetical protein
MNQDVADLYERVRITLDRAERGVVRIADEIEYVLTEGYAYALSLEAEPQRIEKRIATMVLEGDAPGTELRLLARRKLDIDKELTYLRTLLEELQHYCDELKHEGKVAMPRRVPAGQPPDST